MLPQPAEHWWAGLAGDEAGAVNEGPGEQAVTVCGSREDRVRGQQYAGWLHWEDRL